MINALCIDLEFWYSAELIKQHLADVGDKREDQIIESVTPILNLLDQYHIKATFAVLGEVAEKYPGLIKSISEKGHEIASHAYSHKTLYDLGKKGFEDEIDKSVSLLESITGMKPVSFRAPSFSINNSTKWAIEILQKNQFKYDASISPFKTYLYGVRNAPTRPYKPSIYDVAKENPNGEIIEFPMTTLKMIFNIPISGGFYMRVLPSWFLIWAIKRVNRSKPAILYIHPWETYPRTPRINKMPWFSRLITYYSINSSLHKFEKIIKSFEFAPIYKVLNDYENN